MTEPRVSVIIPAYNAAATIDDTLGALAEQLPDFDGVEILVADNGSSDATVAVARQWSGELPLRIVDASTRRGQAAARNAATRVAKGRLLVFTDADDVPMAGWVDAWRTLSADVRFATGPIVPFADGSPVPKSSDAGATRPPVHMGIPYALGANFAVDRVVMLDHGGFDEELPPAEDVDLSFRLRRSGIELAFVASAAIAKRERRGSRMILKQYYAYGLRDPELYRRHRATLIEPPSPAATLRSYAGIVARIPLLWASHQRKLWARQVGRRAGRLVGSVRHRVLYL